jgi:hypothetical protein
MSTSLNSNGNLEPDNALECVSVISEERSPGNTFIKSNLIVGSFVSYNHPSC